MIRMFIIISLIGVALAVIMVEGNKEPIPSAYGICVDLGGIPIRSSWSSQLKDCIFPPEPLEDKTFELKDIHI